MKYDYQTADPMLYMRLKAYSKEMRKFATEAESILWEYLRAKQLGKTFKRQHIIGDYIADFVCLESGLIIELDGGYHQLPEQQINDELRTEWLEKQGFRVIRFKNEELFTNIDHCLEIIKASL
ncbi:MAG: endonuclease domain-containing protein [Bacteroidaceae bacterium]|nr:endonuclease domain-containing protein [Bacteroidaceae bacterium]